MGIFDIDEEKLQALYHRAWHEAGMGFVDPRKYPYLNKALSNMLGRIIVHLTRHG